MAAKFEGSIEQIHEFAARAAYDDEFRRALEENPRDVLLRYGVDIPPEEIPDRRKLPSKAQCAALLEVILDYDSYAEGEYEASAIGWITKFFAHAMPIVTTA